MKVLMSILALIGLTLGHNKAMADEKKISDEAQLIAREYQRFMSGQLQKINTFQNPVNNDIFDELIITRHMPLSRHLPLEVEKRHPGMKWQTEVWPARTYLNVVVGYIDSNTRQWAGPLAANSTLLTQATQVSGEENANTLNISLYHIISYAKEQNIALDRVVLLVTLVQNGRLWGSSHLGLSMTALIEHFIAGIKRQEKSWAMDQLVESYRNLKKMIEEENSNVSEKFKSIMERQNDLAKAIFELQNEKESTWSTAASALASLNQSFEFTHLKEEGLQLFLSYLIQSQRNSEPEELMERKAKLLANIDQQIVLLQEQTKRTIGVVPESINFIMNTDSEVVGEYSVELKAGQ